MKISQSNWLRSLNTLTPGTYALSQQRTPKPIAPTTRPVPGAGWQGLGGGPLFRQPTQQMTGRVGGIQTTAQQTQPFSALLSWLNPSQQQSNLHPYQVIMSWLAPFLASKIPQRGAGNPIQGWTQSLPQNITNNLLRRR